MAKYKYFKTNVLIEKFYEYFQVNTLIKMYLILKKNDMSFGKLIELD